MSQVPDSLIQWAAGREGVPVAVLRALLRAESGSTHVRNGRLVTSPAGAIGAAQLMPGTARGLGVNPSDMRQNVLGGARYLAQQLRRFGGSIPKALAAYNAGPGAVQKYGGVPPYKETQGYVSKIMSMLGGGRFVASGPTGPANTGYVPRDTGGIGADTGKQAVLARLLSKRGMMGQLVAAKAFGGAGPAAGVDDHGGAPQGPAIPLSASSPGGYEWAERLAKRFGLRLSSTYRDPAKNRAVGGSKTSAHLTRGAAADFSGSPAAMRALAEYAMGRGEFREVFYDPIGQRDNGARSRKPIGGHGDHVHITFR